MLEKILMGFAFAYAVAAFAFAWFLWSCSRSEHLNGRGDDEEDEG